MAQDQQYQRGFNNGYLLAKYLPGLLSKILKSITPTNDYFEGFFLGSDEFKLEMSKDELRDLEKLRSGSKTQSRDLEK